VFLTTDHTGTHIDGPLRFDPEGTSIEKIPVEEFLLPCLICATHQARRADQR